MTPSSCSTNLLEWLIELRETLYFLDFRFIIKDITQTADERMHRARYGEGAQSFYTLFRCVTVPIFPSSPALGTHPFGLLRRLHYEAWLIKSLAFSNWNQSQPLSPPPRWRGGGRGWKFHPSNHTVSFSGNPTPSLVDPGTSKYNKKYYYVVNT